MKVGSIPWDAPWRGRWLWRPVWWASPCRRPPSGSHSCWERWQPLTGPEKSLHINNMLLHANTTNITAIKQLLTSILNLPLSINRLAWQLSFCSSISFSLLSSSIYSVLSSLTVETLSGAPALSDTEEETVTVSRLSLLWLLSSTSEALPVTTACGLTVCCGCCCCCWTILPAVIPLPYIAGNMAM